jgi:hypothetical protein
MSTGHHACRICTVERLTGPAALLTAFFAQQVRREVPTTHGSWLDPDVRTVLPEMTLEDSQNLYRSPAPSEVGGEGRSRAQWRGVARGANVCWYRDC